MNREKRGLDPKQVFYALVGGVLGVGFLFLIGSHVQKSFQDPIAFAEQRSQSTANTANTGTHTRVNQLQAQQNNNDYAFFALLDKPVPRRDAPHLNLALNPVQEKKNAIAKRAQEGESAGALVAKGGKNNKAGKTTKGETPQPNKPTKDTKTYGGKVGGEVKLGAGERLGLGFQGKPSADTKSPTSGKGTGTGRSKYTVQVGSFQDQAVAEGLMQDLSGRGYDAYVSPEQVPGKGAMYRVRVGRFESREQADSLSKQVKERDGVGGFVTGM